MNMLARIASALFAASVFVIPLSALAEDKAPPAKPTSHRAESFPMKVERFRKLNDVRLSRMKHHFDQALSRRSLSTDQKADLEKSVSGAMKQVNVAIDKAGADGVVTREEAKQIRVLGEQLRGKIRGELRGKHARTKATGAKPKRPVPVRPAPKKK